MEFSAVKGDITKVHTDAVVLPANEMLKEGRGTSEAIFKKAGRKKLTEDCDKLAPIPQGAAIPTSAYNLPSKYIIHAVVPKWTGGNNNEYNELSSAYLSALRTADEMGLRSIAFPLLSAGNNGFDPRMSIAIAKESIDWYQPVNLENVYIIIYTDTVKALVLSIGIPVKDSDETIQGNSAIQAIHKNINLSKIKQGAVGAYRFINNHKDDIENILDLAKKIVDFSVEITGKKQSDK